MDKSQTEELMDNGKYLSSVNIIGYSFYLSINDKYKKGLSGSKYLFEVYNGNVRLYQREYRINIKDFDRRLYDLSLDWIDHYARKDIKEVFDNFELLKKENNVKERILINLLDSLLNRYNHCVYCFYCNPTQYDGTSAQEQYDDYLNQCRDVLPILFKELRKIIRDMSDLGLYRFEYQLFKTTEDNQYINEYDLYHHDELIHSYRFDVDEYGTPNYILD